MFLVINFFFPLFFLYSESAKNRVLFENAPLCNSRGMNVLLNFIGSLMFALKNDVSVFDPDFAVRESPFIFTVNTRWVFILVAVFVDYSSSIDSWLWPKLTIINVNNTKCVSWQKWNRSKVKLIKIKISYHPVTSCTRLIDPVQVLLLIFIEIGNLVIHQSFFFLVVTKARCLTQFCVPFIVQFEFFATFIFIPFIYQRWI